MAFKNNDLFFMFGISFFLPMNVSSAWLMTMCVEADPRLNTGHCADKWIIGPCQGNSTHKYLRVIQLNLSLALWVLSFQQFLQYPMLTYAKYTWNDSKIYKVECFNSFGSDCTYLLKTSDNRQSEQEFWRNLSWFKSFFKVLQASDHTWHWNISYHDNI